MPVTPGRSCSRGATGEAMPRDWDLYLDSFTWTRYSHLPEQPGNGVQAAALSIPGYCPSCTNAQQLSQAPGSAAFYSSMWTPWTSPSSKGGSQPGGNILLVTRMAAVGCNFSHHFHSHLARMSYPGDKWQWRGSSGICSSAVGFLFLFNHSLGCHSSRCARLMGAGRESPPGPRADTGEAGQSSSLLRMNL